MNHDEDTISRIESRALQQETRLAALEGLVIGSAANRDIGMYPVLKAIEEELHHDKRGLHHRIVSVEQKINRNEWWLRGIVAAVAAIGGLAAWIVDHWKQLKP